jgi:pyruvate formate lyase activating enzyme
MSVDQVIEEILKDEVFYNNSGGGVTLSGGEPILQADFSEALLKECKEKGLHTAVETAGHFSWALIEKIIPYTDLFLYDLKHMDSKIHKEQIGVDNRLILDNLAQLSKLEKEIIVRTPIIPGFNYSAGEVCAIARYVAFLGIHELHLLPYHHFGRGKYRLLGREYLFQGRREPEKNVVEALKGIAVSEGLKVIVGG